MTAQDPVIAIRKEQEHYGRQMAKSEQSGNTTGRYKFNKQDRKGGGKPKQRTQSVRKYEGHEAELHEAIQLKSMVTLFDGKREVSGVILDMDKFAIKLQVSSEGVYWFYKHAFEAIKISRA